MFRSEVLRAVQFSHFDTSLTPRSTPNVLIIDAEIIRAGPYLGLSFWTVVGWRRQVKTGPTASISVACTRLNSTPKRAVCRGCHLTAPTNHRPKTRKSASPMTPCPYYFRSGRDIAVKRYKRPYQWNDVQNGANPPVYRPRMGYSYAFRKIYEL